jgi:hypothetical protein
MLALLLLAPLVAAHNPRAVPYEAVPGYTDCSQMDPASGPHALRYNSRRQCAIPAPAPGSTTISNAAGYKFLAQCFQTALGL